MSVRVIILAAGQGTRMRSRLPKVLHPLGGKPLLEHVIDTARALSASGVHVVYGHGGQQVPQALQHKQADWVEQAEQLGTGHAVAQAADKLVHGETTLILYGDVPLVRTATLQKLVDAVEPNRMALLTVQLSDPTGYGRIVRSETGTIASIIEHKDASDAQRAITEVNTGILAVDGGHLKDWLTRLRNDNAQGEYYLTDIISLAVEDGMEVVSEQPESDLEVMGVNDRVQLSVLEREYQVRRARELMMQGVTLRDPHRFDVRGTVEAGTDVSIDVNVVLDGTVTLGDGVSIGANCVIHNSRIASGVEIRANCVIENAVIGANSCIGPFARIRPETRLAEDVHIGNFVEIKKTSVEQGSKINHLSYVGDARVGKDVNIGAGTITCNYDGANKHLTIIEDGAFIGSDTQLVAPVTIGKGATIGAGSTVTRDAPDNELTLSRARQETRAGWQRPRKKDKS